MDESIRPRRSDEKFEDISDNMEDAYNKALVTGTGVYRADGSQLDPVAVNVLIRSMEYANGLLQKEKTEARKAMLVQRVLVPTPPVFGGVSIQSESNVGCQDTCKAALVELGRNDGTVSGTCVGNSRDADLQQPMPLLGSVMFVKRMTREKFKKEYPFLGGSLSCMSHSDEDCTKFKCTYQKCNITGKGPD